MNVLTRGIRNAFRNVIRTLSIVVILGLSVGLALAMLIANKAVSQRIASVQGSVGNTVSVSPAGVRGFEGGGDALTADELKNVKSIAHVTSVTESLNDRLTTDNTNLESAIDAGSLGKRFASNNGQRFEIRTFDGGDGAPNVSFTPPVTVNGTTDPANLSIGGGGGGSFKLIGGKVFSGTSTDNTAVVGKSLATKNNLKVGSTFTAYGTTITVSGIFDAGNSFADNQVIMPLATVQKLSGQAGAITAASVKVDSVTNIDSVTTAVQKQLGDKADVVNEAESAKQAIAPLKNIQTISLYSLIGAVTAGAVIILLTMIMIVRERRREIGVIKAIGASNIVVMGQFMAEAITLTVMAAVIGIGLGVVAGNPLTRLLVNNSTDNGGPSFAAGPGPGVRTVFRGVGGGIHNISATVGWDIILYGLGAAIIIAVVGSALASFFIAKIRPSEVMRAE